MTTTTKRSSKEKGEKRPKKSQPKKRASRARSDDEKKEGRKRDRRMNAKNADRYELYQRAVNSPEADIDFIEKAYRHYRGKDALHFREDFCGTSALCAEWLSRGKDRTAEGVDLDPEPIEWGKKNNFDRVEDGEARMTWHIADVRSRVNKRPDVTAAQNFSYWCFHTRAELLDYFRHAYDDLADDGVFVVDLYGGPEATVEQQEVRSLGGGIEYVWDQKEYHPATARYFTAIHFRFRDGSEMTDAFEYDWRCWSITEIRDVMLEAGFRDVSPWFEGTDPEDEEEGNGVFEIDERGEHCEAWIAYLAAAK